jgi:hypothetical protein
MLGEPHEDEEDSRNRDHKNQEHAYYRDHPAGRPDIIDVSVIVIRFVFISFHVETPFVGVPP